MATLAKGIPPDEILTSPIEASPQTDSASVVIQSEVQDQIPDKSESVIEITTSTSEEAKQADFSDESGSANSAAIAAANSAPPERRLFDIPIPNTKVLSIDDELGVKTEFDEARDKFLDLVESMRTGRYLTDKIQGVERHSDNGEPRAILFHGDYKVVIMASMLVSLPRDLRDQEPNAVYYYLLTKRLGAEIDYVVKGIDPNSGLAVASRMEAMSSKRRHYYTRMNRDGTYRIYEGLCCEARVISVIPDGIFVDLFGMDIYIPLRELSHVRLTDAMGYFEPGQRIIVKVTRLDRSDPDHIRVSASVKRVSVSPIDKALEKLEVGSNYAGTVSMIDATGIFVLLDIGADCRCTFPYRSRPPKGARVVVKIVGINHERKLVWGHITYVTIPK